MTSHAFVLPCIAVAALLCGCARTERDRPVVAGGDAARGRAALLARECGACHRIPGIPGAQGTAGPPLDDFAERLFIAGREPNRPDKLVAWIRNAPAIDPGTAMPDLGVTEAEARDIAAYLYDE